MSSKISVTVTTPSPFTSPAQSPVHAVKSSITINKSVTSTVPEPSKSPKHKVAVQTVLVTLSTTTPTMHGVLLHPQLLMAAALSGVLTMVGTTMAGTPMA